MDDLITWLRAQLDEDERVALGIDGLSDDAIDDIKLTAGSGAVEHLRRFGLDRALAEVDAKRRILEAEQDRVIDEGPLPERMRDLIETDVIKLLALPYADRPGYREEWKP